MNNELTLTEFIDSPDTVDFVAQSSGFILNYIKQRRYMERTGILTGGYVVAYVDGRYLDNVINDLGASFFASEPTVLGLMDEQALDASGITQIQNQPYLSLKGQGILVGIVDTGIDYTQEVFRYEDGATKIVSIYDQNVSGQGPYDLGTGAEYTREQINLALNAKDPLTVVPQVDTVGHGTFLASVAAGSQTQNFIGAAPDAELVVVKLSKARPYYLNRYLVPPDQDNAYESTSIMLGVEYIIRKAEELKRPVAICLGLGSNYGGHDGQSLFEEYLNEVGRLPGVSICMAAGNESMAKHHYRGIISQGQSQDVAINVGEDAGDIYLSMWNIASDLLSVAVASPTGEKVERISPFSRRKYESQLLFDQARVIIEYLFPTNDSGSQNTVIKILNATPGTWTISVYGELVVGSEFHIWLPITGFVSPNVEFVAPDPYYTMVIPATAATPIRCGGYDDALDTLYSKTSFGPNRLDAMMPDLVAPCVDVGGFYPDGYGTMTGTSVAAAIATGASALMLEWGIILGRNIAMSTNIIRAYLIRGAIRSPYIEYPNYRWGYGQLNLINAFELMM